ncbi:Gag protease polyprotein-like protein [Cucumis melo var. makuwa]|uniref:Gag protease polyprotein-like protein n=1 Tax=Cucumis melo var. makuwa TaxID=1194695 RepID=A0A5A7U7J9_CUCMM|nr:Gag protease polyprotein-like protein [Cucumis melo var. makuwa]
MKCCVIVMLVEGLSMFVDLLPLELQMLDVILGMEFLYTHYASMDCHKKEVIFRKPGLAEVVFRCQRKIVPTSLISALEAEKLLRKGYTTFSCTCSKSAGKEVETRKCFDVNKFLNVFPVDLSGSPLDRKGGIDY